MYGHTPKSSKTPLEEFEEIASEAPLPTFSQSIRNDLPTIMQRIVADSISDVDADILVLGSLTVFSSCIPNVFGVYDLTISATIKQSDYAHLVDVVNIAAQSAGIPRDEYDIKTVHNISR